MSGKEDKHRLFRIRQIIKSITDKFQERNKGIDVLRVKPGSDFPENNFHDESNVIPESDLARWKKEVKNFRKFSHDVELSSFSFTADKDEDVSGLAAMFLGEKPACFANSTALIKYDKLKKFGFRKYDRFVYHPDLFKNLQLPPQLGNYRNYSADQLIRLASDISFEHHDLLTGIILGFPLSAAEDFEKVESFKTRHLLVQLYDHPEITVADKALLEQYFAGKHFGKMELIGEYQRIINQYGNNQNYPDGEVDTLSELNFIFQGRPIDIYHIEWIDYGISDG